jgi:hypothetical protein
VTSLPAGVSDEADVIHAIDRDGGSLCALVEPGGLTALGESAWSDPLPGRRCVACSFLMTSREAGQF